MKSLIILPAIFISFICHAQNWFSENNQGDKMPGYVLGMAGDTIQGFIKYDYPIIMQKRISFYPTDETSKPIIYSPENIWGFSVANKKWISATVIMETYDGQYTFKRFGILQKDQGALMLLRIFNERDKLKKNVNSAEAEKDLKNIDLNYPDNSIDQLYIKKTDGEAESLTSKAFKKSFLTKMRSYVGDNKNLLKKIESKEYSLKDIFRITEEYNQWAASGINKN